MLDPLHCAPGTVEPVSGIPIGVHLWAGGYVNHGSPSREYHRDVPGSFPRLPEQLYGDGGGSAGRGRCDGAAGGFPLLGMLGL